MIRWLTHNTVTYRHLHLILHKDLLINTYTTCAQTDSPSWSPISRQTLGPLRKTTTSIYHKRRTWIWITGFWDLQKKKNFFCHLASAVENAQSLWQYLWIQTKVYQLLYWLLPWIINVKFAQCFREQKVTSNECKASECLKKKEKKKFPVRDIITSISKLSEELFIFKDPASPSDRN